MQKTMFSDARLPATHIKCLTIRQPWAHLIVTPQVELPPGLQVKRIENRSRPINFRGRLLIHAGKSRESLNASCLSECDVTFGAILGVCEIIDCVAFGDLARTKYASFAHATGPWCWVLGSVKRFENPVPYVGQIALFNVPLSDVPEV